MQLRSARLCLDCEEVHDEYRCPVCASEAFTYMTRWVPVPERRNRPRPQPSSEVEVYRKLVNHQPEPRRGRLITRAVLGLTAASVVGLFWGSHRARVAGTALDDSEESD